MLVKIDLVLWIVNLLVILVFLSSLNRSTIPKRMLKYKYLSFDTFGIRKR